VRLMLNSWLQIGPIEWGREKNRLGRASDLGHGGKSVALGARAIFLDASRLSRDLCIAQKYLKYYLIRNTVAAKAGVQKTFEGYVSLDAPS